ncbi:reverse transcriptase domain-containing protein, partial [Enterobacter cloacae complex sp. 2DZ2F20B]|uniref:reverse transcriptase domain-containing protein n=1 Tax=Enterobacter cloacae complex sp. 2DZ2F20B TaxID=2511993 RepID=UPI001CA49F57
MVNVTSGVPQGSILGPLLFLIFVNDIGYKFESPYRLFPDDLKIFRIINSRNDVTTLQRDLGHLEEWCVSNNMFLNEDKCHAINFSRKIVSCKVKYILNGQILNFVSEVRDLGITLDSKLTFIPHYEKIVCRANKILGCVTRYGSEFKNLQTIKTL